MTFFYSADDLVEKVFLFCCVFIDVGVGVGCCLSNTITVVSSYQKVAITLKAKKTYELSQKVNWYYKDI